MALTLAQGAERLHKLGVNVQQEVPKHAVKAVATRFKHTVKPLQHTHTFKNFGGTGKSSIGTGAHFKLSGSGSGSVATVTPYGPFGIEESGAKPHVILPKAGRGQTRSGKTRTRRGAQGLVSRRLAAGKAFRSLEGGSALTQHALAFPDGTFSPYANHPGTRGHHTWAKSVGVIGPQATVLFERSLLIGMTKVGL